MYTPKSFAWTNQEEIKAFVDANPFAVLISTVGQQSLISHVPINYNDDKTQLIGHFARNNPQATMTNGSQITAVFSGPHAYISPRYYQSTFNVPTWNYAAVHCAGTLDFMDDDELAWKYFQRMVDLYESTDGWKLPDEDRFRALVKAIRFFVIRELNYTAVRKFNQNKSDADQAAVLQALENTGQTVAAQFMRETLDGDPTEF